MKEKHGEDPYLHEDLDLIERLEVIKKKPTGVDEYKIEADSINIEALLRGRKSARDTENSNIIYSNVILIFTAVQVLFLFFELFPKAIDISPNWVGFYYRCELVFWVVFMSFVYFKLKRENRI